ncbi:MAG: nucleotidyltransferase domain-containing protein [Candidatus Micrarchaeota archaeon]|nr:nucleotidyltransferase domain-containing protein [Candidatus Micrarchaeota archaeon]
MRRIFGKRELAIIQKQAWGVALSQSEKNRLSRDIRKKLEAVNALAPRFSDDFRLKKGAALNERVGEVLDSIKKDPFFNQVTRVWLYGSSVQGLRHLGSDVDVAVEFKEISETDAGGFRKRVLGQFEKDVDVQVYGWLPKEVKAEVRNGKMIYERQTESQGG